MRVVGTVGFTVERVVDRVELAAAEVVMLVVGGGAVVTSVLVTVTLHDVSLSRVW